MARKRDPRRDEAFEIWEKHNGDITNRAIAEQLDVPEKTISAWKSRDKWNGSKKQDECSTTKKKRSTAKKKEPIAESSELTDKQRLFCIYYIKSFNATISAIKAGYASDSAHVQGSRLLRNDKVADEIRKLKGEMQQGVFIDAMDVLNKYIRIAFADITDYAVFGKKEQQVIGMYGPLEDDEGNPVMQEINYVDFNESTMVDGTIITEVKQGKDGISVKLADKMKALEMLTKYFDLLSEKDKKQLQEEKLKAEIVKTKADAEFSKERADKLKGNKKDTGLLDALIEGRKQYENRN